LIRTEAGVVDCRQSECLITFATRSNQRCR